MDSANPYGYGIGKLKPLILKGLGAELKNSFLRSRTVGAREGMLAERKAAGVRGRSGKNLKLFLKKRGTAGEKNTRESLAIRRDTGFEISVKKKYAWVTYDLDDETELEIKSQNAKSILKVALKSAGYVGNFYNQIDERQRREISETLSIQSGKGGDICGSE